MCVSNTTLKGVTFQPKNAIAAVGLKECDQDDIGRMASKACIASS